MEFYKHKINESIIFNVPIATLNSIINCIHFDNGLYIELSQKAFDFFILAYDKTKLTRDQYKELFCKK